MIWCKLLDENAPGASEVDQVSLDAVTVRQFKDSKGRKRSQMQMTRWTGKAFCITDVLEDHGFVPIRARQTFMQGGEYAGAEWWHFQWEVGLVRGKTTFGEELLRVYTLEDARKFVYWDEAKGTVFGKTWG